MSLDTNCDANYRGFSESGVFISLYYQISLNYKQKKLFHSICSTGGTVTFGQDSEREWFVSCRLTTLWMTADMTEVARLYLRVISTCGRLSLWPAPLPGRDMFLRRTVLVLGTVLVAAGCGCLVISAAGFTGNEADFGSVLDLFESMSNVDRDMDTGIEFLSLDGSKLFSSSSKPSSSSLGPA